MLIESVCIPKRLLTTVSETCTLEDALNILEESGFRCVPVLDETGKFFRGNIYKMHIYRHKSNGGDMTLPVTHLIKNATKFIHLNSSFFKIFFTIKELPYIAVLDANDQFYGILTHSSLLGILSQSWNVKEGRFALTIASTGRKGDLANMTKIISKYSDIASCITLDVGRDEYIRRTIITLPADTDKETCDLIIKALNKKDFFVAQVEDLQQPLN
ncbi:MULTISPECIES: cyclic di-AMP binding protein CbpA [Enterococcaceae]|uniref:cyclic di-AMP binding protein CbpA n=1 Tax=Enterococcaceae TaxID=81852 RepID=UPI000E532975|nr:MULTISPECIES: cyclic di-AMP binding protein CbpA [Enterococcaceae]MCI0130807.1 cyclic di-AMP binding protein CbpA [Vagococcus sp. CY53-2]RGI30193.1 CBS domain-containing protein [Melissococcus sp. OM08-11BH]UNM89195.1 cyclic di-AMP binding protein CbpA [Vagococcus sp. CY52-2]